MVVVIPLIRWYCGESHTTSFVACAGGGALGRLGGDYDHDGLCYLILNSDDFTFNKYFIIFTQFAKKFAKIIEFSFYPFICCSTVSGKMPL